MKYGEMAYGGVASSDNSIRIRLRDGSEYEGDGPGIVSQMMAKAFGSWGSQPEYIQWLVDQLERTTGTKIVVEGNTDEQCAASLIGKLVEAELAEIVK